MAKINFIKTARGLTPAFESDADAMSSFKIGEIVCADIKKSRNLAHHKKFYALLNVAFEYYEPSNGVLTRSEKALSKMIFETLEKYGANDGTMIEFGRSFMSSLCQKRKSEITDVKKSFEAFRREVIIESGWFDVVSVPGGIRKEARSISFSRMDQTEFNELYTSVFSAVWNLVLSKKFTSQEDAENAINQLISF